MPESWHSACRIFRPCRFPPWFEPACLIVRTDGIVFKARDNGKIINGTVKPLCGLKQGSLKEVFGMWVGKLESSSFWMGVLTGLKAREVMTSGLPVPVIRTDLQMPSSGHCFSGKASPPCMKVPCGLFGTAHNHFPPLIRLQFRQSIWQFSGTVVPPSFQGLMWSASISSSSKCLPQCTQMPFWRS